MPVFNISNHHDRMHRNNLCNSANLEGGKAFDMHSLGTNLFPFSKTLTPSQGFSLSPGVSMDYTSPAPVSDSATTSPMVSVEQCCRTSSSIRKKSPACHLSTPIKRRRQPISCDSESDSGGSDSDQSANGTGTDRSYLIASALIKRRLHATGEGSSTLERNESRQPLRCSEPDFRVYAVLHSALRLEAERATTANANSERAPLHLSSHPGAGPIGHQRRNSSDLLHAQSPAKLARLRATPLSSSWSDLARAAACTPSQLAAREQIGTACGGGGVALSSIAATPAFCASSPQSTAGQTELPKPPDSSSVFCSPAPSFEMGEPDADL